jgi:hypothetical protein
MDHCDQSFEAEKTAIYLLLSVLEQKDSHIVSLLEFWNKETNMAKGSCT